MKRNRMKNWLCAALLVACAGMGMTACSSSDENEEKEEYTPVESPFASMVKQQEVYDTNCEINKYRWETFTMSSNPIIGNTKRDYYLVHFTVKSQPVTNRKSGRYKLADLTAYVDGFDTWKEYAKNTLIAGYDEDESGSIAKGAWVELQYLNETDEYGHPKYTVKLHADELLEKNNDYARNVNITYTGYIYDGMLKY